MKKSYDIAVIGGGASGLAAAITSARMAEGASVAVFEKKETTGKKLSAAGNGRCNISNIRCENPNIHILVAQKLRIFGAGYGLLRQCRNFPA